MGVSPGPAQGLVDYGTVIAREDITGQGDTDAGGKIGFGADIHAPGTSQTARIVHPTGIVDVISRFAHGVIDCQTGWYRRAAASADQNIRAWQNRR